MGRVGPEAASPLFEQGCEKADTPQPPRLAALNLSRLSVEIVMDGDGEGFDFVCVVLAIELAEEPAKLNQHGVDNTR